MADFGVGEPRLESEDWSYVDLHRFVRSKGGFIVLAHPYRYRPNLSVDLFVSPPDAIEIRSNNIRGEFVPRIQELANRLGLPTLCNSDAHSTGSLGRYYNIVSSEHSGSEFVLNALRAGSLQHSIQ